MISQINKLTFQFKKPEKKELKLKSKVSWKKEIMNARVEINKVDSRKWQRKSKKPKFILWKDQQSCTNCSLSDQEKRWKCQITKIENERGYITTNLQE